MINKIFKLIKNIILRSRIKKKLDVDELLKKAILLILIIVKFIDLSIFINHIKIACNIKFFDDYFLLNYYFEIQKFKKKM